MIIKYGKPWFWSIIEYFNPHAKWGRISFTFGNTIYTHEEVPDYIIEHEKQHIKHQRGSKLYGLFCLLHYNFSPSYRLTCEIDAYRAQLYFLKKQGCSEEVLGRMRRSIANSLSSPLYGEMITFEEALKLL